MTIIRYDIRRGADIYRTIDGFRLQRWISTGKIKKGEVLVWRSGLSGWRKPEELEELKPSFDHWQKLGLRIKKVLRRQNGLLKKKRIKNILIIDDEKDMCSLLCDSLSERGYNVSIGNTKREALWLIKSGIPDLVFLDLKLPDGDGMKVLSRMKKINPQTIVNIISAYGSEERKEEAKKRGAYTFIDKPFTEKEILKSIREVS